MVDREHTQTVWKNTYSTYKRQFTMIDGLIAETKICSNKLHDPEDETEGKDARRLIEPIEHKLGLIKRYISKLYEILPEVAEGDDGDWCLDSLSKKLDVCMQRHTDGTRELGGFIDSIEQWEMLNIKETKPEGRRVAVGGRTPAGGGAVRPSEIKGVATTLKPEELTVSIQAHEMTAWTEQWAAF